MTTPLREGWLVKGLAYAALGSVLVEHRHQRPAAKSPITSIREFLAIETAFTAIQWLVVGPATAVLV